MGLLPIQKCLNYAERQNVDGYGTETYITVLLLLKKVKNSATAASHALVNVLVSQVSDSGSEKIVTILEFITAAMHFFCALRKYKTRP